MTFVAIKAKICSEKLIILWRKIFNLPEVLHRIQGLVWFYNFLYSLLHYFEICQRKRLCHYSKDFWSSMWSMHLPKGFQSMPIVLQNALHSVPILVTVSGTSQYIRKRTCLVASTWLSRQQQQIWLKEEAEDYGILMKFSFWRQRLVFKDSWNVRRLNVQMSMTFLTLKTGAIQIT